jgi:hypothetical protein
MGVRISMPVIRREVNSDISEDYTLPDYYPEIRKLLFARPSPLLPAKFVSGTKVDVSGVVDYTLIYLSADGKLCSAPLSAEYSFSLPVENMNEFELGEGLDVMAHTVAESTSVRVSAPRRIQLRSHLRTSLSVFGKKLCAERITGLCEGADIERLRDKGESCELLCESSDVISLEDSFELGENERIALADGIVALKDQRVSGETIRFDGEILIWMLSEAQDGAQREISRRLPLEAEIELDGDYYPITECRGSAEDWYAMQFDDAEKRRGFVQIIRNADAEADSFNLVLPCIEDGAKYVTSVGEFDSEELRKGIEIKLGKHEAKVISYNYH